MYFYYKEYLLYFFIGHFLITNIVLDICIPLGFVIKAIVTQSYYEPYDILGNKSITGLIRKLYIKRYHVQIYNEAMERNFKWLKLNRQELDSFFRQHEVSNLTDKLIILEMCNRKLGYAYDGEIIFYKNDYYFTRVEKLLCMNINSISI